MIGQRSIPAGAGNTPKSKPAQTPEPVYPRWRGEHIPYPGANLTKDGLSPLARGTLVRGKRD